MAGKIKYQGGLTRFLCIKQAAFQKKLFKKNLKVIKTIKFTEDTLDFEIISFSGSANFEDQILSIVSLLFYVGKPIKWTIYSDKSYGLEEIQIFKELFDFVEVKEWDLYDYHIKIPEINKYFTHCVLAKKLNIILGHKNDKQTIYLDSDIVFYKNSSFYLKNSLLQAGLWYAPDALGNVGNYFSIKRDSIYPLNSGFLIINNNFIHEDIYIYLKGLENKYNYFTEQSSFEYAYRKQQANMLDPRQFVIDTADQFDFSMKYQPDEIAMRHYTSPVRHKMWQKGWKWHFH